MTNRPNMSPAMLDVWSASHLMELAEGIESGRIAPPDAESKAESLDALVRASAALADRADAHTCHPDLRRLISSVRRSISATKRALNEKQDIGARRSARGLTRNGSEAGETTSPAPRFWRQEN